RSAGNDRPDRHDPRQSRREHREHGAGSRAVGREGAGGPQPGPGADARRGSRAARVPRLRLGQTRATFLRRLSMSETVDVRPPRGVRFAGPRDVSRHLCPPYDRIPDSLRTKLYANDPHNAVRLTFPRPETEDASAGDRYARAAKTLRAWIDSGVLKRDADP